ncbi:MAG: hypothetical protein JW840_08950 [Candidatus Thermoplasmatota archaeon]|nr:hypothetical protein [Candidatus Thermoplasmatota archaeon]
MVFIGTPYGLPFIWDIPPLTKYVNTQLSFSIWYKSSWYAMTPFNFHIGQVYLNSYSELFSSIPDPIVGGLTYLSDSQQSVGSWSNNVGITSLCTLAFLNYGYTEQYPKIENAINWILGYGHVHPDGSIYAYSQTYETALALLALVAADKTNWPKKYTTYITNAKNWLVASQWDEDCLWGSVNVNSWYYGGFGYGSNLRPDLSNTQWAMMALQAAGATNEENDNVWNKALIHANRCQARDVSNDQNWANGKTSGGFIYTAGGDAVWGGSTDGYGSMTAAGIWSLLLSGVEINDPRVENNLIPYGAIDWFENRYTWEENPGGTGSNSQYYFYVSMAKALTMARKTRLVVNDMPRDWYDDMFTKVISLQRGSGYWMGTSTGMENDRNLATAYALLALQTCQLPIGADLSMSIILESYCDLHLYDNQGGHIGKVYDEDGVWTGEIETSIFGSSYELVNGKQIINLSQPEAGTYRIELIGTGSGLYHITFLGFQEEREVYNVSYNRSIAKDEVHLLDTIVTAMEGALTIFTSEPKTAPIFTINPKELTINTPLNQVIDESFEISSISNITHGVTLHVTDMVDEFGNIIGSDNFTFDLNGFDIQENVTKTVNISIIIPEILDGEIYHGKIIIESSDAGTKWIDVTINIQIDAVPPSIIIEFPYPWASLQDNIKFQSMVTDTSGISWVKYAIRTPNGSQGMIINSTFESLLASFTDIDKWSYDFDTIQLPDGFYLLYVNASDSYDNIGYTTVNFSIRNWAVLENLPNTPNSNPGRTMPIKFSLRVVAAVDPEEPFVWNEELTIKIYAKGYPGTILQTSTYGTTSTDYRISSTEELYITNFKTQKTPKTYVVDIWRDTLLIGSFEFQTVK